LALAGAGVAVLAAALAHAQPSARQLLRPGFEDTDDTPRLEAPRRPVRRDTRPVGARPNATNSDGQPQSYATAPGSGAGTTGFVSTFVKRRAAVRRKGFGTPSARNVGPTP